VRLTQKKDCAAPLRSLTFRPIVCRPRTLQDAREAMAEQALELEGVIGFSGTGCSEAAERRCCTRLSGLSSARAAQAR
jgi:hypothetical protein